MTIRRLNSAVETINGWTVKHMPDGTVEMRKSFDKSGITWGEWGSVYEGIVANQEQYPYTFASAPGLHVDYLPSSTAAVIGFELYLGNNSAVEYMPQIIAIRPTTSTNNRVAATIVATGVLA